MATDIRSLLQRFGIRPSKGLGQNFLMDERLLERIVEASAPTAEDTVLEVGPGLGWLTAQLAERAGRVVAVELDQRMLAILRETLSAYPNLTLVHGDILEADIARLIAAPAGAGERLPHYQVVANLPYYITSAAIRKLLETPPRPARLTLMVQREVAQRIIAAPGDLSLLAISVQVFGRAEIVARVPAAAFYPSPKVDSAILCIHTFEQPQVSEALLARFFEVVRAGFGQKRKQLHNSLSHGLTLAHEQVFEALDKAHLAPERRPQTLSIAEWLRLTEALECPPSLMTPQRDL
jgi:16S rRNA (adenine1518-N6/adenine1519-N6)-dimethyltransferase